MTDLKEVVEQAVTELQENPNYKFLMSSRLSNMIDNETGEVYFSCKDIYGSDIKTQTAKWHYTLFNSGIKIDDVDTAKKLILFGNFLLAAVDSIAGKAITTKRTFIDYKNWEDILTVETASVRMPGAIYNGGKVMIEFCRLANNYQYRKTVALLCIQPDYKKTQIDKPLSDWQILVHITYPDDVPPKSTFPVATTLKALTPIFVQELFK